MPGVPIDDQAFSIEQDLTAKRTARFGFLSGSAVFGQKNICVGAHRDRCNLLSFIKNL